jgi:hypothetical protein
MFVLCLASHQVILMHRHLLRAVQEGPLVHGDREHADNLEILAGLHAFYDLKKWGCERSYAQASRDNVRPLGEA